MKSENYKKIKGLMSFAKQTFLNEKGVEIEPTLENLEMFKKELREVIDLINRLGYKLTGRLDYV